MDSHCIAKVPLEINGEKNYTMNGAGFISYLWRKVKVDHMFTPSTKDSGQVKVLNVKNKILNLKM